MKTSLVFLFLTFSLISFINCQRLFDLMYFPPSTQALLLGDTDYTYDNFDYPSEITSLVKSFKASGRIITKVIPLYTGSIDTHMKELRLPSEALKVAENAAFERDGWSDWYMDDFNNESNIRTKIEEAAIATRVNEYVVFRYVYSKVSADLEVNFDNQKENDKDKIDDAISQLSLDIVKSKIEENK